MADLSSAENKINDVEVAQDAPVTESLLVRMGGSINWLIDEVNAILSNPVAAVVDDSNIDPTDVTWTTIYTVPTGYMFTGMVTIEGGSYSGVQQARFNIGSYQKQLITTSGVGGSTTMYFAPVTLPAGATIQSRRDSSTGTNWRVRGVIVPV